MTTEFNSIQDVLEEDLLDLYSAETQIADALPVIIKRVNSRELREALRKHLDETQDQVTRLENAFKTLDIKVNGKICQGMQGVLAEGAEVVNKSGGDPDLIDLAIVSACRRVEHYEIAAYSAALEIAQQALQDNVADLLERSLNEEELADEALGTIVREGLIPSQAQGAELEDEEEVDTENI